MRQKLTDSEFNAISHLTHLLKLDDVFDIVSLNNNADGWVDYENQTPLYYIGSTTEEAKKNCPIQIDKKDMATISKIFPCVIPANKTYYKKVNLLTGMLWLYDAGDKSLIEPIKARLKDGEYEIIEKLYDEFIYHYNGYKPVKEASIGTFKEAVKHLERPYTPITKDEYDEIMQYTDFWKTDLLEKDGKLFAFGNADGGYALMPYNEKIKTDGRSK